MRYTLRRHEHAPHIFLCDCNLGDRVFNDVIGAVDPLSEQQVFQRNSGTESPDLVWVLRLERPDAKPGCCCWRRSMGPRRTPEAVPPNLAGVRRTSGGPPFMNVESCLSADFCDRDAARGLMASAASTGVSWARADLGALPSSRRSGRDADYRAAFQDRADGRPHANPFSRIRSLPPSIHRRPSFSADFTPSWLGSSIGRWERRHSSSRRLV